MGKFKELQILKDKCTKEEIPAEGIYVNLNFMFGDANGYDDEIVGPFPLENSDIALDFINVLEKMLYDRKHCEGGWDSYNELTPESEKYFYRDDLDRDEDGYVPDEKPEFTELMDELMPEIIDTPDGFGEEAIFIGYETWYHNGETTDKYEIKLTEAEAEAE